MGEGMLFLGQLDANMVALDIKTLDQHVEDLARRTCSRQLLVSTRENRRQEEFNNRGTQVRRRVDRRSVGWLYD
jgi:hypothetical protein